eukprot:TRINITY_DN11165_c0_g1_i1.p1 TRINITY_DN11165_c0_g1~~TRINITY_DN11165_c0_g1_i1.p1  ORF type:complete len:127 (+),score=33.15 TRINITY_DN11165_c0_g1_i1:129-509(+)
MNNNRKIQIKKNNEIKGLSYKINNRNFLMQNQMIFNLRKLNHNQLFIFLESKGFKEVALSFKKELVDGMSFIIISCQREGIKMMSDDFKFSSDQIKGIMDLYCFIYKFRSLMCKNFKRDELPFYHI